MLEIVFNHDSKSDHCGHPQPPFYFSEPTEAQKSPMLYGPPGAFTSIAVMEPTKRVRFTICCPGCGKRVGVRDTWAVLAGSIEDVTTLTLDPSLKFACCGWHGYLKNGVFSQ
jgi:Family of unknown function (DUF6527)